MYHLKPEKIRPNCGFTLVELLVAAVLVLVAIVAVIAAVRKTTDMQINDFNRRQAAAVIMQHFEHSFSYHRFQTCPTPPCDLSVHTLTYSPRVVRPDGSDVEVPVLVIPKVTNPDVGFTDPPITIALDDRIGGTAGAAKAGGANVDPLPGFISFRAEQLPEVEVVDGNNEKIEVHEISIRVTWEEVGGVKDTVVLTKRLAFTYDK